MTHELTPLILAALLTPLAGWLGWSGFRITMTAPCDTDTEGS